MKNKGEILVDVAGTALAAMLGILVLGRAINSPLAYRLNRVPLIGAVIGGLRASTNQIYDVSGEN